MNKIIEKIINRIVKQIVDKIEYELKHRKEITYCLNCEYNNKCNHFVEILNDKNKIELMKVTYCSQFKLRS